MSSRLASSTTAPSTSTARGSLRISSSARSTSRASALAPSGRFVSTVSTTKSNHGSAVSRRALKARPRRHP